MKARGEELPVDMLLSLFFTFTFSTYFSGTKKYKIFRFYSLKIKVHCITGTCTNKIRNKTPSKKSVTRASCLICNTECEMFRFFSGREKCIPSWRILHHVLPDQRLRLFFSLEE